MRRFVLFSAILILIPVAVRAEKLMEGLSVPTTIDDFVNSSQTALVVVDMQNMVILQEGYCGYPQWTQTDPIPENSDVDNLPYYGRHVRTSKRVLDAARKKGMPIIFVEFVHISWERISGVKMLYAPETLPKTSRPWWWARTCDLLAPRPGEMIVYKHGGDGFEGTNFDALLRNRSIKYLVMTGIATHGCLCATTFGAEKHGYIPVLVKDCLDQGTLDNPETVQMACDANTYHLMRDRYPTISADQVIAAWEDKESSKTKKVASEELNLPNFRPYQTIYPPPEEMPDKRMDRLVKAGGVDPSHTAVIVVDMQNEFVSTEGGFAQRDKDFIANPNKQ